MATLNDAQRAKLAEQIFVMGKREDTRLPRPKTTGPAAFQTALDPLRTRTEFKDVGIGVIDFTKSLSSPDVWLHNEDKAYRIGSATKVAMLLAAVQLRLDVRRILKLSPQIISTAADFDQAFGDPKLWAKAKPPVTEMRKVAANPPLISEIFDFTKTPVDFKGPDPNGRKDAGDKPLAAVQKSIVDRLPPPTSGNLAESTWEKWTDFNFSERLWLAGCRSDNVAATSCVSQIGVPYLKAVQRSYGLADHPDGGMHLLASWGYDEVPRSAKSGAAKPPRPLTGIEPRDVLDYWWDSATRKFTNRRSWVPGSAAALTAYMLALMSDTFTNDGSLLFGGDGCTTIRKNLADGGNNDVDHVLVDHGVLTVPNTKITRQIDKIGLLQKAKLGAKAFLRCEFIYLETTQDPAPATGRKDMKYAIVATGVIADADTTHGTNAATKSARLGASVHQALLTL